MSKSQISHFRQMTFVLPQKYISHTQNERRSILTNGKFYCDF